MNMSNNCLKKSQILRITGSVAVDVSGTRMSETRETRTRRMEFHILISSRRCRHAWSNSNSFILMGIHFDRSAFCRRYSFLSRRKWRKSSNRGSERVGNWRKIVAKRKINALSTVGSKPLRRRKRTTGKATVFSIWFTETIVRWQCSEAARTDQQSPWWGSTKKIPSRCKREERRINLLQWDFHWSDAVELVFERS